MAKQFRLNLRSRSIPYDRYANDSAFSQKHPKMLKRDVDALHSVLLSFTLLARKFRLAQENLPKTGRARPDFRDFLNEVEPDLKIAIAILASELGFAICRCCWPPEVLAADLEGQHLGPVPKESRSKIPASIRRLFPEQERLQTRSLEKRRAQLVLNVGASGLNGSQIHKALARACRPPSSGTKAA